MEDMSLRDAAVLVPVVDSGEDARVIFTLRTTTLRKHSGQIAFPGGSIDPEDGSPEAAAIREAEEEIGLARHFVEMQDHYRDPVSLDMALEAARLACQPHGGRDSFAPRTLLAVGPHGRVCGSIVLNVTFPAARLCSLA